MRLLRCAIGLALFVTALVVGSPGAFAQSPSGTIYSDVGSPHYAAGTNPYQFYFLITWSVNDAARNNVYVTVQSNEAGPTVWQGARSGNQVQTGNWWYCADPGTFALYENGDSSYSNGNHLAGFTQWTTC
jgi:hypothetical protein